MVHRRPTHTHSLPVLAFLLNPSLEIAESSLNLQAWANPHSQKLNYRWLLGEEPVFRNPAGTATSLPLCRQARRSHSPRCRSRGCRQSVFSHRQRGRLNAQHRVWQPPRANRQRAHHFQGGLSSNGVYKQWSNERKTPAANKIKFC